MVRRFSQRIRTREYKLRNKIVKKIKKRKKRSKSKKSKLNERRRDLEDYPDEKEYLEQKLNEEQWRHYYQYGGTDEIQSCKRIKKHQTYNNPIQDYNGNSNIEAYQAKYIVENDIIPSKYEKISHFCANPLNTKKTLCIESTHMDIEPIWMNNGRRTCHCLIRKYERSQRWNGNTPDGPLFANDVPISFYNELLKKKGIKRSSKEIQKTGCYSCPHGPNHCFINYTKWGDDDLLI